MSVHTKKHLIPIEVAARERNISSQLLANRLRHAGQKFKKVNGMRMIDRKILECADAIMYERAYNAIMRGIATRSGYTLRDLKDLIRTKGWEFWDEANGEDFSPCESKETTA
jgi:hypothetical protein